MNEGDARVYLMSIGRIEKTLAGKLAQIEEIRTVAENCSISYDKDAVQTSGAGDKLTNLVGKIVDLQGQYDRYVRIVKRRRETVEKLLPKIEDERNRDFINLRYLENRGFYDCVMELNVSDSTGKRIQKRSIKDFAKIYTRHIEKRDK